MTNFSKTVIEDTTLSFTSTDFTNNYSDSQNSLTHIRIASLPSHGTLKNGAVTLTVNSTVAVGQLGNITYLPAANVTTTTNFTREGSDGVQYSNMSTVTLTITAVNDEPAGTNNTVTTNEDTQYTFTAANFGFTDPNDSPANALNGVRITTLPGVGNVQLNGTNVTAGQTISVANINSGLLKFVPVANANGTNYASFTFQVQDNGGTANGGVDLDQSANTMTINVTAVNDAPTISDISNQSTNEDTALNNVAFTISDIDSSVTCASVTK